MIKSSCTFEFDFDDERVAENLLKSTVPDNGHYLQIVQDGSLLRGSVPEADVGTLKATLDDFLECLSMAFRLQDGKE